MKRVVSFLGNEAAKEYYVFDPMAILLGHKHYEFVQRKTANFSRS